MHDLDTWGAIIRDGFYHIKPIQGVLIGLLFGLLAVNLGAVFVAPLLGAAVYIAADVVIPALVNHTAMVMPVFDAAFWHFFAALYVAFLLIAAVVYALRNLVWNMQGWRAAP